MLRSLSIKLNRAKCQSNRLHIHANKMKYLELRANTAELKARSVRSNGVDKTSKGVNYRRARKCAPRFTDIFCKV